MKITPEDKVKVLDFGLAKPMENAPVNADLSNSPTLSMAATQAGVILGTAAYMSPEQAKGAEADSRTDVFSFGCVLYEMLTGRQAFQGESVSEILAAVLIREADLSGLPPDLNPRIPFLLRRCLEKNPKRRWQAVGDLRAELETIAMTPRAVPALPSPIAQPQPLWKRAIPVLVTAVVFSAIAGIVGWNLKLSGPALVTRFPLVLPEGQDFGQYSRHFLAISPDSTKLVYSANQQLFLRQMSEMEARPIPGAAGAINPFFSPDGQWVGFFSRQERALKKIALAGGAAITICKDQTPPVGVSWDGDQIVFGEVGGKGIMRVSANGGEPEILVSIKAEEGVAFSPQILDRGQAVLFTLAAPGGPERWDQAQIVVQSLASRDRRVVVRSGSVRWYRRR